MLNSTPTMKDGKFYKNVLHVYIAKLHSFVLSALFPNINFERKNKLQTIEIHTIDNITMLVLRPELRSEEKWIIKIKHFLL